MTHAVTIENDIWRITLQPELGGSVTSGEIRLGDTWQDVMRPSPADIDDPRLSASYPLAPWSNRIRDGVLTFNGRNYQMRRNSVDGTAMHGAAWEYPWKVTAQTAQTVTLTFESTGLYGVNWPWNFSATYTYALEGDTFVWTYSVTNIDEEPFPAGFGSHPYFQRQVAGSTDALLTTHVSAAYALDAGMADAPAGEIRTEADFREQRPLGPGGVDDCFTGRTGKELAHIEWPGAVQLDIAADADLTHAVLYIPVGRDYWAFEPVSHVNNGFALAAAGQADTGIFVLEPGETRTTSFTMRAHGMN
ncbi:hypothetical protein [Demequina sediminicola]|uniref:aldose epimerase family protein n=1 Tax=Demequina sediminicola TaxID=1095026 RepID=UPI0007833D65|nr:hypothetical protein [Demequina sediminicola]